MKAIGSDRSEWTAEEGSEPADGDVKSSGPAGGGMLSNTLRALRHRNYQLFFGGQLISLIGTWMQNIAQSWLVYSLTHSAVQLGIVGFASQIPVFLFAPVGGAVADRYDKHRVLV